MSRFAVFATERTIQAGVFDEEIKKRCPNMQVVSQSCPELVNAIEGTSSQQDINRLVETYVRELLTQLEGRLPHWAILGCTHFPLVEALFQKHLPASCRVLSQPKIVAHALEHYLQRHPRFLDECSGAAPLTLLTTGDGNLVEERLVIDWPERPRFQV